MKKIYSAPTLELIDLPSKSALLEGSLPITGGGEEGDGADEGEVLSSKRPGNLSEDIWGKSSFGKFNVKF